MERSLTARLGLSIPAPAPRRRAAGRKRSTVEIRWPPLDAVAGLARAFVRAIARRRRVRIALLVALLALPLLAGGWLTLRNSSLVAVEHVRVGGVHGSDARAIEAALAGAARHMSTLDVHPATLRAAVASFPVVRAIRAIPSFPHGLRIEVAEQPPVAAVTVGGARTAVAADGVVLGPALLSGSLPVLSGSASAALTGRRLHDAVLRGALTVLGDAPVALGASVKRAYMSPEGLTVAMGNGLLAYFGDASLPHAKWLALARVLADPSSRGAAYVDVRLPERPAAGFSGGVAPGTGVVGAETGSVSDPSTAAQLAAGLTTAVGGSSSPSSTTAPTGSAEAANGAVTTETPAGAAEATLAAPTEATPKAAAEAAAATPAPGG